MYYILLVETLTTAFIQTPGLVNQLDKQPRNTLKALNPLQEGIPQLDEKMKIFFESAVITEELFCKPLRVLSANPKISAFEFKSHCAGILEELEEALENQGKLIELWTRGQRAMRLRLDDDITKAICKTTSEGKMAPVRAFVPGARAAQKALPGSGQRLTVFGATMQGIIAALKRNLLYARRMHQQHLRGGVGWRD